MKKLGLALLILLALTLVLASCTMTPAQSTNPPATGNTSYYVFFEGVEDIPFQTIPENGFATAPEAPEKEGYTFAGWLDEAGNLFNFEETPITKNTTLTAKWDILTYTVTFYGPDGAVIAQNPVNWGEGVIRPNLSLANNQEFRGWFTEPNGQGEAFKVGEPVYADASYHAHVLTGAYVRFNGEDGIAIAVYFLLEGEVAQAPIPADKSGVGKEFMGWFDENGNEFDPAATYTENVSYTARYSQNSVVVKFMSAGKLLSEVRLEKGEAVERPADPTRAGYIFGGWQLNGADYDFAQAVQESIILNAVWTEEPVVPPTPEYTVSFAGEGVNIPAQTVKEGEKAEKPADPVREGYIFGGWQLNGEAYNFASPVSGDITLTAVWTAEVIEDHTVTFVDGEGNVLSTQTVPHGGNATMPTLSGDTYFAYDLSKLVNVREDITLVVTPVAKSEYANKDYYLNANDVKVDDRITFDGFLASWGSTVLYNVGQSLSFTENFAGKLQFKPAATTNNDGTAKFTEGQSMTIEIAVDGIVMLTLTVDANFTRQFYTVCDNVPAGEHTLTVTVVAMEGFTTVDKYGASIILANIMYNEKTAPVVKHTVSFAGEGVDIAAQEIVDGETASKPADPTREGYVFAGWLLDGAAYDFAAAVTGDITLTASWTEQTTPPVEPTEYTVTFVDGEGNVIATQTVVAGANATLPTSADYYYTYSPVDALCNITADKTIVLGTMNKADFALVSLTTTNKFAEYDNYFTVNGKGKLSYGTTLYKDGTSITLTSSFAGPVEFYIGGEKLTEGQYFDLEVLIDGVVVNTVRYSTTTKAWAVMCYVSSYGEHTVTLRIAGSANIDSANGEYGSSVMMTACRIYTVKTECTVTFSGEGVTASAQNVAIGEKVQRPADPTRDGYTFAGWLLDGVAYDFDSAVNADITLVASWTANSSYTVTFVNPDGEVIATETVLPGGNAKLPTSNDYFYEFSPVDALYNIQENKTVILTPVAKTGYSSIEYSAMGEGAYTHAGMSTTGGTVKNYATLLYRVGQEFNFTTNMAGLLQIKFDKFNVKEGQSISIDILVDGVVVNKMVIEPGFARNFYDIAYIPTAGEHTVTVRVTEMVGVASPNYNWGVALGVCNVIVSEATAE